MGEYNRDTERQVDAELRDQGVPLPPGRAETMAREIMADHVVGEGPAFLCAGCGYDSYWPCDAAKLAHAVLGLPEPEQPA